LKSSPRRTHQQQKNPKPNNKPTIVGGDSRSTFPNLVDGNTLDGNVAVKDIAQRSVISESSPEREQWPSARVAESRAFLAPFRVANVGGIPVEGPVLDQVFLNQHSLITKRSAVHGSFALSGIILLSTLAICLVNTGLEYGLEDITDLNLLTAGSSILLPTIVLAGSHARSALRSGEIWRSNTLATLASLTSLAVALTSLFTDSHGLGFTVLTTAIISNTTLWVRESIVERAPTKLRPVPESLQKPEGLLQELLTPTEEERFFIERSCQLILLASLLSIIVMMARGTSLLEALSIGSFILLLLPLPLVVEIVPTVRALLCRSLQSRGVFVEHSETIDAIEGASTMLVEIPDHLLSAPPAPDKGIWEFEKLDIFDGRFDENNLTGIIASLCAKGSSRFAREVARAFAVSSHQRKNPQGVFRCQDFIEIDSTTISGTIEGVPLLIGKEGIFIQKGIFLSGHEVVVPSDNEEGVTPSHDYATSPHKLVVLLVGVGHACVARLVLRLRWDYRGLEAARELDRRNLIQTSVISTGPQPSLDAVCSALQIDLARSHGAVSDYRIQQRVIENDPSVALFVNPERLSSTAETLNATVKIVSILETWEEFDTEIQLRNVRNVVRLAAPSVQAVQDLFEIPRKALFLRQGLLVSSVVLTSVLYILLLFVLCSPLICGGILFTYMAAVALAVTCTTKDRS
jgi:hypothetical protein